MGYYEISSSSTVPLPECCVDCERLNWESEELSTHVTYFCRGGLMFPMRKQTCKRKKGQE